MESPGAADLLPFLERLDADMIEQALAAEKVRCNDCIDTPIVTLALFRSQAIDPDHSCRAAVARLIAWLVFRGVSALQCGGRRVSRRSQATPGCSGLSTRPPDHRPRRGRGRSPEAWLWKERRVYLVDGTTVSMPDTPANQAAFPQSRSQERGLGFPIARVVVLISLGAGLAREAAVAPTRVR